MLHQIPLSPSKYASFMQTGMVKVGAVDLCFEIGGKSEDPTILLIMGLGCQMLAWPNYFCEALIKSGFRVVRFDNRDIGLSTRFKNTGKFKISTPKAILRSTLGLPSNGSIYNLYDMAADASGLIDALGLAKVHVIGASMGGMIAQILAAQYPEKVETLSILFSGNLRAFSLPPAPKQLNVLLARPKLKSDDDRIEYGVKVNQTIGTKEHISDSELRSLVTTLYYRSYRPDGFLRHFQAILTTGSLTRINKKIKQPTLVVHGSEDKLMPPSNGRAIKRAIKNAKFELIPGMAHDIPQYFTPRLVALFVHHINMNAHRK